MLTHTLATFAHTHTATHNYAFLIEQKNFVYVAWIHNISIEDIEELGYLDIPASKHASRGATLRYKGRQTKAFKMAQERNSLQCIGTRTSWESDYKAFKEAFPTCKTKGDFFEFAIARMNNIFWGGHNSDDGREKGDLIIDGIHWQLKANGGNFANESQMRRWWEQKPHAMWGFCHITALMKTGPFTAVAIVEIIWRKKQTWQLDTKVLVNPRLIKHFIILTIGCDNRTIVWYNYPKTQQSNSKSINNLTFPCGSIVFQFCVGFVKGIVFSSQSSIIYKWREAPTRPEVKEMTNINFRRGTTYTATNYRTRETFPVVCVSNRVGVATFETENGKRFDAIKYSSTASYNMTARNDKLHVLVRTKEC